MRLKYPPDLTLTMNEEGRVEALFHAVVGNVLGDTEMILLPATWHDHEILVLAADTGPENKVEVDGKEHETFVPVALILREGAELALTTNPEHAKTALNPNYHGGVVS